MIESETKYKERSVYDAKKRIARGFKRPFGLWRRKDYDVRILSMQGEPHYKKVVCRSEERAATIYQNLQIFRQSPHFPRLVGKRKNKVTVHFVRGMPPSPIDDRTLAKLTDFYAAVYGCRARLKPLNETHSWTRFERNLSYLREQKVLDVRTSQALSKRAWELAPARVWVGFDYTDPIKSNLLLREGERVICAIDIKNLHSETLIGRGVAKARRRWLSAAAEDDFFEQLRRKGAPDFQRYFPFIRIFDAVQRITNKLAQEAQLLRSKKIETLRKTPLALSDFVGEISPFPADGQR